MHSFADTEGRRWKFSINMWTVREVKRETGWDLANILSDIGKTGDGEQPKLQQLFGDRDELFSVWCTLLSGQMEERGLSPEDLGRSLAGETIADANDAFVMALADFFPDRQSKQLKALQQKGREVAAALATKADKELETIDVGVLTTRVLNSLGFAESSRGASP